MNEPRYTKSDRLRFRLPYVRAAAQGEGYLAERMKQYAEMVKAERRNVEPIAKGKGK